MAKVSFTTEEVKTPTPVEGVTVDSKNTAAEVVEAEVVERAAEIPSAPVAAPGTTEISVPAPRQNTAVATRDPLAFDDNNIGFDDIIFPRLNIVQNVGDLMQIFESGDIVLNASQSIHQPTTAKRKDGNPPLNITVIGLRKKQFVEKVAGSASGRLVETEEDVARVGGTLAYKEWEQSVAANKADPKVKVIPYFQPYATALVVVERPAHVNDEGNILFPYEFAGKQYALALWGMKGTAYTKGAKVFYTARKIGHLNKPSGYLTRSWDFTTKLETFGSNVAWVPVLKPATENTPDFITFVKSAIGL